MNNFSGRLTKREKDFCSAFVSCGNAAEAARSAGFENDPDIQGERLLCRSEIIEELDRLSLMRSGALSRIGYQRLAFGSVSDAVSLLYMLEKPDGDRLKKMDLFQISEIKRSEKGSIEIKFFDRLKALEMLSQDAAGTKSDAPLYDAIMAGAAQIGRDGNGN